MSYETGPERNQATTKLGGDDTLFGIVTSSLLNILPVTRYRHHGPSAETQVQRIDRLYRERAEFDALAADADATAIFPMPSAPEINPSDPTPQA